MDDYVEIWSRRTRSRVRSEHNLQIGNGGGPPVGGPRVEWNGAGGLTASPPQIPSLILDVARDEIGADVADCQLGKIPTGRKLGCLNPWETLVTG